MCGSRLMPKAPRVCSEAGCTELTDGAKCEQHRLAGRRTADRRRPGAWARGYNARWERTRRAYIREHPRCEHPTCSELATDVDHIDGLGPTGPRGHDWPNLQALCHSHHSVKTAAQDGAFGRRRAPGGGTPTPGTPDR